MQIDRQQYRGENLVFVVGCPRSGTTWLQRLLATHPGIQTGQETHLFNPYLGAPARAWAWTTDPERAQMGRGGVGLGCYLLEDEFYAIYRNYAFDLLERILAPVDAGCLFLEKTPHHALFIPEIKALLPDSRFIHLIRDPFDVVKSLVAASRSWGRSWAPSSPLQAARLWRRHVQAARNALHELPADEWTEVHYEHLKERPQYTLGALLDFLGLTYSDDFLQKAVANNRPEVLKQGGGTPIPVYGHFAQQMERATVEEPDGFIRSAKAPPRTLPLKGKLEVWLCLRHELGENGYSGRFADLLRRV